MIGLQSFHQLYHLHSCSHAQREEEIESVFFLTHVMQSFGFITSSSPLISSNSFSHFNLYLGGGPTNMTANLNLKLITHSHQAREVVQLASIFYVKTNKLNIAYTRDVT